VDPVSPARQDEGGIPRIRRGVDVPPGGASAAEDLRGANEAKAEKLWQKSLRRRAGKRGLQLRHSAYGYALIDPTRKPINDRTNMTLDEIESWLARS
jgi:hypothetical protein